MAGAVRATHLGECGQMDPTDPILGCSLAAGKHMEPQEPNQQNPVYEETGLFWDYFLVAGDLVRDVFLIKR